MWAVLEESRLSELKGATQEAAPVCVSSGHQLPVLSSLDDELQAVS